MHCPVRQPHKRILVGRLRSCRRHRRKLRRDRESTHFSSKNARLTTSITLAKCDPSVPLENDAGQKCVQISRVTQHPERAATPYAYSKQTRTHTYVLAVQNNSTAPTISHKTVKLSNGQAIIQPTPLSKRAVRWMPTWTPCRGRLLPAYRDSVTLEGETEFGAPVRGDGLVASCCLGLGGLLAEVLDAHATLDGPYREPLLVREDRHASADRQKTIKKNRCWMNTESRQSECTPLSETANARNSQRLH